MEVEVIGDLQQQHQIGSKSLIVTLAKDLRRRELESGPKPYFG
jgi:hypothetical protein